MKYEDLRFFNPYADVELSRNKLPHWQQEGAVYFVTFRLGDSVPTRLLDEWTLERSAWLKFHPEPWADSVEQEYHNKFSGAMERWLDAGYGSCLLRKAEYANIVGEGLSHFDGIRYSLISAVIMPNHIHTIFVLNQSSDVGQIIKSWKGFTARRINSKLTRSGSLWQKDYFDRLVRDRQHFGNCVRYIRRNPEKARLKTGQCVLIESDLARSVE